MRTRTVKLERSEEPPLGDLNMNTIAFLAAAMLVGSSVRGNTQPEPPIRTDAHKDAKAMTTETAAADKWSAYEIAQSICCWGLGR